MEGFEFYQEEGRPFQGRKLEKMKVFLARQGLDFDTKVQYSVVLRTREGEIAACGSRQGNVLKCIAVDHGFQGEGLMVKLMSFLMKDAWEEGIAHLFVFTKPVNQSYFQDLGFWPIMDTQDMLLMENKKNGIRDYLKKEAAPYEEHFFFKDRSYCDECQSFYQGP